jgi:hypothetical protein
VPYSIDSKPVPGWGVVGAGVVVAPVSDAGLSEGGEGDGVAVGFGEEVAAEAEHVRPPSQGAVSGFAAHPPLGVADVPAGVDEPFGVGSGRVRVQAEGIGGDAAEAWPVASVPLVAYLAR